MSKGEQRLERGAVVLCAVGIVGFLSSGSALGLGLIDPPTYLALAGLSLAFYLALGVLSQLHQRI